jgi:hypothetical protein
VHFLFACPEKFFKAIKKMAMAQLWPAFIGNIHNSWWRQGASAWKEARFALCCGKARLSR